MLFCCLIFFKINFFKNSCRNTIVMSNCLDLDQDQHCVSPDRDPKLFAKVISWKILHAFLSSDFFQNQLFQKNYFRNTIVMSNCLDLDQNRHCVSPDLDPNCLQRLLAGKF